MKNPPVRGAVTMAAPIFRRLFLCCNQIQKLLQYYNPLKSLLFFNQKDGFSFSEPIGSNYSYPTTFFFLFLFYLEPRLIYHTGTANQRICLSRASFRRWQGPSVHIYYLLPKSPLLPPLQLPSSLVRVLPGCPTYCSALA